MGEFGIALVHVVELGYRLILRIVVVEKTQNGSDRQVLAGLQIQELSFIEKRFGKLKHIARPGDKNFIVCNTFPGNTVLHFIITHILFFKFIRRILVGRRVARISKRGGLF